MATSYGVMGVCSFFSAVLVNKIGKLNVAMGVGAICYTVYIFSFILPSLYSEYRKDHQKEPDIWIFDKTLIQTVMVLMAAILGMGAGILWAAQGNYISELACDEN